MADGFTWAYGMVLAASLLPIVSAGIAKKIGARDSGGCDNSDPRAWLEQQRGAAARANAAQQNGFEVLPFFIGAVLIAHQLQANQTWIDLLAIAFVLLRVVYVWCYVVDKATLRSLVWTAAFGVNVAILLLGAF